ncbi:MAG: FAD-dependent oxidoreductase [Pseudomonas sp.]|jgi:predicted NAD/FAD-binding protein|nr:FAD-dependent oxidoreductase [Pseudomonas sp.]MDY0413490.1 FAD-dependent oxidoreductase [Pseudomonas sp.]NLO54574.1 FAD-dependent oxidoreductase [Gammaproteobacteria bacterium]
MFDPEKRYRVAVIGSGISGSSSAWFLSQKHDVTLFEKNPTLGGHTNTLDVVLANGDKTPVDTGFIVYNEPNYPLLKAMLAHLNVATHPTDMSFAVSIDQGRLEYAGNNLNTLFAQRKNLFSVRHWRMIADILRFNAGAQTDLVQGLPAHLTLGEYLAREGFGQAMQQDYLLPMAAAIWSCPTQTMLKFPAQSFLQFFANHGLLSVNQRPQWRTVIQGARTYLEKILALESFAVYQQGVTGVTFADTPEQGLYLRSSDGLEHQFDQVVFACHADEAYALLEDSSFALLKSFSYQYNQAWLHTDSAQMPASKRAWASWNYLSAKHNKAQSGVAVTYWMNALQPLATQENVFVTLNPLVEPRAETVLKVLDYQHPVFDRQAIQAQAQLPRIQGVKNCWFVGAYTGYGFHEDGLASAVALAQRWQLGLPWEA